MNIIKQEELKAILPKAFQITEFEHIGGDEVVRSLNETMGKPVEYNIFPSHFKLNVIQKMIIYVGACSFADGKDGTPNRYVVFPSHSRGVNYHSEKFSRMLYPGIPFFVQFPLATFGRMFWEAANIHFAQLVQHHNKIDRQPPMYEIHFVKLSKTEYKLLMMRQVEYSGDTISDITGQMESKFMVKRVLFEAEQNITKRGKK
jgi:hypothetical protein